jgi:pyruvate/2-oxoglutarate dehydrogenase complex dihydrolipoamide acyltransferase (E2) component
MLKGLYTSIFGATDEGIFDILYSRHGASPPVKRTDIRLGDYGQADEEEEPDAAAAPTAASAAATPAATPASSAPAPSSGGGFFAQDIGGFPLWLVGVGFLGFAWAIRRKRKKQSSRRK